MTTTAPQAPEFDAAAITVELVEALNRDRCRDVIAHYGHPTPPKSAKLAELKKLAQAAILQADQATPPQELPPEPPAATEPATEEAPGVELEPRPSHAIVETSRFAQIVAVAEYLSESKLIPDVLYKKPHDVGAILLRANDLGIPMMSAVDNLYVVHGKVGMEGKLMRALIRRDGHSITDDPASDRRVAIVHGVRVDNGDKGTASFDLQDALDMDLIAGYDLETGEVTPLRDKPQYKKDTANMLKWRATARLARDLFSDCLAGVSYTPDELGYIDAEGTPDQRPTRHGEATVTVAQQRSELAERVQALDEDLRKDLGAAWTARHLPRKGAGAADFDALTPGAIRTVRAILEPMEAKQAERENPASDADVEDAVLVDDAEANIKAGTDEFPKGDGVEGSGEGEGSGPGGGEATGTGDGETRTATGGEEPLAAAPSPAGANLEPTYCGGDTGVGCGEEIKADQVPVFDNRGQAFHPECSPDLEG